MFCVTFYFLCILSMLYEYFYFNILPVHLLNILTVFAIKIKVNKNTHKSKTNLRKYICTFTLIYSNWQVYLRLLFVQERLTIQSAYAVMTHTSTYAHTYAHLGRRFPHNLPCLRHATDSPSLALMG